MSDFIKKTYNIHEHYGSSELKIERLSNSHYLKSRYNYKDYTISLDGSSVGLTLDEIKQLSKTLSEFIGKTIYPKCYKCKERKYDVQNRTRNLGDYEEYCDDCWKPIITAYKEKGSII